MGIFSRAVLGLCVVCLASPVFGQLYSITTTGQLFSVNTSNAVPTFVGNTGIAFPGSLEFNPSDGLLYCMEIGSGGGLWRINPANAAATFVGNPGVFIFEGGLQFAPNGTFYGTNQGSSSNAQLFTVNPATGATSIVGTMPGEHDVNGLAWRTSDNMLIGLDRPTNSLLVINPATAAFSTLAAVPETVSNTGGMAGSGSSGFYNPESDNLYSVNLLTGASVLIGAMGIDSRGLALIPEPSFLGLIGVALLLSARRR